MHLVCPQCGTVNRVPPERLPDSPVCGRCATALAEPHPVPLGDDVFATYIERSDAPVLVDFWAEWCGPCRMMAPQFDAAAQRLPGVRFAKVDTDAHPRASVSSRVRSIPTLVLFHGGQEVARRTGATSAGELVQWVQAHLKPAPGRRDAA
jgi:thioredoxin 2